MKQDEADIKKAIEQKFGFKKELIKNIQLSKFWEVRFEVNGVRYYSWIPYHGAQIQLMVEGYNTPYHWKGTPLTEEYYKKFIEGKLLRLVKVDPDTGDRKWMEKTFADQEEAEKYIRGLNEPGEYTYDIWEENNV